MAAASPLLDAAVQLEVGAREQCECDPCCSDGEEFDEACSHGTHCAACQVWQTGLWKDCCVYLKMGIFGQGQRFVAENASEEAASSPAEPAEAVDSDARDHQRNQTKRESQQSRRRLQYVVRRVLGVHQLRTGDIIFETSEVPLKTKNSCVKP